jgi:itaconyl-CoA hydratase
MIDTAFHVAGPDRYREHFGLFFEQFAPGMRFVHRPGVTLSQQDNVDETLDSYNGAQIHFDARYAGTSSWQRPLMVSTLTVQRLVGMTSRTFGCRRDILGFREIGLTSPVFGGDTIYAESEVLECRPGDAPGVGVVTVCLVGRKDRDNHGEALAAPMPFAKLVMDVEVYTSEGFRAASPVTLGEPAREARFACYRDEDGARIEQCGLFFEDARAGESFIHSPRRSFYRADLVTHARRAFDFTPPFHDAAYIAQRQDGRLRVPETVLLGAVTALTTRTFGRVSANLGWTDIRLAPVYENDTVEAESTVVDARESKSRPNEGVLTVDTFARNQHGAEVCRYRRNLLVYRRDGDTPYAKAGY